MKLYADVNSDRARKGQGGNKFIRIDLTCGSASNQINAGMIEMEYITLDGSLNEYDQVDIRYFKPELNGNYQLINEIHVPKNKKGEKLKTAKCTFNACQNIRYSDTSTDYDICKKHFEQGING